MKKLYRLIIQRKQILNPVYNKESACKSLEMYRNVTDKCKNDWEMIAQSERKGNRTSEEQTLDGLKHSFTLVISADYQMNKLLPHWGESPQPGSTYYLQKVSYNIFGVVDHRDAAGHCYLFSECIGPKNTDHTVSYIFHYLR